MLNPAAKQALIRDLEEAYTEGRPSLGRFTEKLEDEATRFADRRFAFAVNNGTTALKCAVMALDAAFGSGTTLHFACPSLTVPMVSWAVIQSGHNIFHVDSAKDTPLMSLEALKARHEETPLFGAIISHTGGLMTSETITMVNWCKDQGIFVIEDASHAHGCEYDSIPAGSLGDISVFSLYGTKVVGAQEGGLVVTDNEALAGWVNALRNQGKVPGTFKVDREGINARMSEVNAVVAYHHLLNRHSFYGPRKQFASLYRHFGLKDLTERFLGLNSTYYKYIVPVADGQAQPAFEFCKSHRFNLAGQVHGPNDEYYDYFPVAKAWSESHICLPVSGVARGDQSDYARFYRDNLTPFLKAATA